MGKVIRILERLGLRSSAPPAPAIPNWKVWETVTLGHVKDYLASLTQENFGAPGSTQYLVRNLPRASSPVDVDLVLVDSHDLGCDSSQSRSEIYSRAKNLGLELCPPEVGPALRLARPDAPTLNIAMEPLIDESGSYNIFLLEYRPHDREKWSLNPKRYRRKECLSTIPGLRDGKRQETYYKTIIDPGTPTGKRKVSYLASLWVFVKPKPTPPPRAPMVIPGTRR